jgi:hypothetical protein
LEHINLRHAHPRIAATSSAHQAATFLPDPAFGADQIVMGTDYSYDVAEYDPIGQVASADTLEQLTQAAIRTTRRS